MEKTENIYFDAIPMLRQEYKLDHYQESLDDLNESILDLMEAAIPKPLAKAYKNVKKDNRGKYVDDSGKEPDRFAYPNGGKDTDNFNRHDDDTAIDVHTHLNSLRADNSRRASRYDFGKSYYKKLTKVQCLDALGLAVYVKPSAHNTEENTWKLLSSEDVINKPLPKSNLVVVKDSDGKCKENISKMRFVTKVSDEQYNLSEFEYRSTGEYFPIIRETIPDENFIKYGVDQSEFIRGVGRADMAPGNGDKTTPKEIIYVLKTADYIWETDEYSHPINSTRMSNATQQLGTIESQAERCYSVFLKSIFLLKLLDLFNQKWPTALTDTAKERIENVKPKLEKFYNSNIKELSPEFIPTIESGRVNPTDTFTTAKEFLDSFAGENLNRNSHYNNYWVVDNHLEKFKTFVLDRYTNQSTNFENIVRTQSPILRDKLQQDYLDSLDDPRFVQLLKRRYNNVDKISVPNDEFETRVADHRYEPYDYLTSYGDNKEYQIQRIDTGDHNFRSKDLSYSFTDSNLEEYAKAFRAALKQKKHFIAAQQNYINIKNHPEYYDSEEEYQADLQEAKEELNTQANDYKELRDKFKNLSTKTLSLLDTKVIAELKQLNANYAYLQLCYSRSNELNGLIDLISTYSKDEIITLYGSDTYDKLQELRDQQEEAIRDRQLYERDLERQQARLEELRRQIAEVEEYIQSDKANIENQSEKIFAIQKQMSDIDVSVDGAVVRSYQHQMELQKDLTELGQFADSVIQDINKQPAKQKTGPVIKLNDRLKNIIAFKDELTPDSKTKSLVADAMENIDNSEVLSDPDEDND